MITIKVVVLEDMKAYESDRTTLLWEVTEGDVLTAEYYAPSQEFFAINEKGQEVYVGEITYDGSLILEGAFRLERE